MIGEEVVAEAAREILERDAQAEGDPFWDLPPVLMAFFRREGEEKAVGMLFNFSDDFWDDAVPRVLRAIALASMFMKPPLPTKDGDVFLGLLLRTEGWALQSAVPEKMAEYEAWQEAGKDVVDHPDAVEVRMMTSVTSTKVSMVEQVRRREIGETAQWDRGSDSAPGGGLIEGLEAIYSAFLRHYPAP